jgi:hypothetical protein
MDVHFFLKNRVGNQEIKNISDSQVYRLSWKALVAVFLMPRHVGFFFFLMTRHIWSLDLHVWAPFNFYLFFIFRLTKLI